MTSLLIKSFNRPFYLDRCLQSIDRFVQGDYEVTVLDDGTPPKYLDLIKEKYPNVQILLSENYEAKTIAVTENLLNGKEIDGFQIPTRLWREAVGNASQYFIMIEDDVWFTEQVNVSELAQTCAENKVQLLKLGWLGNKSDDAHLELGDPSHNIQRTVPTNLLIFPGFLNDWFFYNRFNFFSLLYRLKLVNNTTKRKYWALNSILMGFWQKEYWLQIWKDAEGRVDEKQQLRNAASWFRKNRSNKNMIARLLTEAMKTTFKSSATNSYHAYGYRFDVNYFNHLINEAWYRGDFDSMQNFPQDFSSNYFEKYLDEKIDRNEWRKWMAHFQEQYRNLGADVD